MEGRSLEQLSHYSGPFEGHSEDAEIAPHTGGAASDTPNIATINVCGCATESKRDAIDMEISERNIDVQSRFL